MMKETIRICHTRGDTHFLTPDPAWSRYSFGLNLCLRDEAPGVKRDNPLAGAAARLLHRVGTIGAGRASTTASAPFVPLGAVQAEAAQGRAPADNWLAR